MVSITSAGSTTGYCVGGCKSRGVVSITSAGSTTGYCVGGCKSCGVYHTISIIVYDFICFRCSV